MRSRYDRIDDVSIFIIINAVHVYTSEMFMNHVHTSSVSVDRAIRGSIANDPQNLAVFIDHMHPSATRIAIVIRDARSVSIRVDP